MIPNIDEAIKVPKIHLLRKLGKKANKSWVKWSSVGLGWQLGRFLASSSRFAWKLGPWENNIAPWEKYGKSYEMF